MLAELRQTPSTGHNPTVPDRFIPYPAFAEQLTAGRAPGATLLIGIDGAGGSGKSTLARGLAGALGVRAASLVHVDDFYRPASKRFQGPPGARPVAADYDLERLVREVLAPLRAGRAAAYRRHDWAADALASEVASVAGPIVVVEGVYATSAALRAYYDMTLWVDCPRELRLERGLARDGAAARERWVDDWMPGEDLYVACQAPMRGATFVCDGSHPRPERGVVLVER